MRQSEQEHFIKGEIKHLCSASVFLLISSLRHGGNVRAVANFHPQTLTTKYYIKFISKILSPQSWNV